MSRLAHLEKIGQFFQVRLSQSVLIFSILVPVWFTSLVFFYLSIKLLFLGFLQFEGDFALRKNDLKYRDIAPLTNSLLSVHCDLFISTVYMCNLKTLALVHNFMYM